MKSIGVFSHNFKSGKYLPGLEVAMNIQYYYPLICKNVFSFLSVSPDVTGREQKDKFSNQLETETLKFIIYCMVIFSIFININNTDVSFNSFFCFFI